jgi:hypothetical protein
VCPPATEQLARHLHRFQCEYMGIMVPLESSSCSQDMACNVNGAIAASGTCAVSAGDTLAVEMHQQSGDRSCSNEAIGGAHYGPTIVYMASE